MLSTVYSLPPRISVTGSVGITTLPIFSSKPKACILDSRDSFTFFSNPEYVWMMYHFMFGLAVKLSSAGPVMFCSSISCCEPSDAALARATMQHPCNDVSDSQVNQPEI